MNLTNDEINGMYQNAVEYFRTTHPEWLCTIEQGFLVAQLNPGNIAYYNGLKLSETASTYRCVVKITPDGKFYLTDVYVENYNVLGLGGLKLSSTAFAGRSIEFHYQSNKDGSTYKFSTRDIQKPLIDYFKSLGLTYKFYSYKYSLMAQSGILKVVTVVVPLFCGLLFIPLSFVFDDNIGKLVFLICGGVSLLWGIINLIIILKENKEKY